MATEYTLYLVNQSASQKTFWAFLQPPDELAADPGVFANSSAQLAVEPNARSYNRFIIPVQYSVAAGASNQAVGLNTRVVSDYPQKTDLGKGWLAEYANAPPPKGPKIKSAAAPKDANQIAITANNFNQVENEGNGWFSNMSFGIQTSSGYMGMTWSPAPGDTRTLTPKLEFYVTTGSFGANSLADWTDINSKCAKIQLGDFDPQRRATVTLGQDGTWSVVPGAPQINSVPLNQLLQSHLWMTEAHGRILRLAGSETAPAAPPAPEAGEQDDWIKSVQWLPSQVDGPHTYLSGRLAVRTAITLGFTAFVLAGIVFRITRDPAGGTEIFFTYSGPLSAEFIKSLFVEGAKIVMQSPGAVAA